MVSRVGSTIQPAAVSASAYFVVCCSGGNGDAASSSAAEDQDIVRHIGSSVDSVADEDSGYGHGYQQGREPPVAWMVPGSTKVHVPRARDVPAAAAPASGAALLVEAAAAHTATAAAASSAPAAGAAAAVASSVDRKHHHQQPRSHGGAGDEDHGPADLLEDERVSHVRNVRFAAEDDVKLFFAPPPGMFCADGLFGHCFSVLPAAGCAKTSVLPLLSTVV